jgi:hypothetical protein
VQGVEDEGVDVLGAEGDKEDDCEGVEGGEDVVWDAVEGEGGRWTLSAFIDANRKGYTYPG